MGAVVLHHVVLARELARTSGHGAGKVTFTGVDPVMACQMTTSSESLIATWVRARILALREAGLEGHTGGPV